MENLVPDDKRIFNRPGNERPISEFFLATREVVRLPEEDFGYRCDDCKGDVQAKYALTVGEGRIYYCGTYLESHLQPQ